MSGYGLLLCTFPLGVVLHRGNLLFFKKIYVRIRGWIKMIILKTIFEKQCPEGKVPESRTRKTGGID